jgi:hypothetical protein
LHTDLAVAATVRKPRLTIRNARAGLAGGALTRARILKAEQRGGFAMDNLRFFGLALSMFVAVFFGMRWLLTPQSLQPDARIPTFQRVEPDSPRAQFEASSISDNDTTRDKLRHAVLDDAKALNDDPCNSALKQHYVEAANNYARALTGVVPCLRTQTCGRTDWPRLELAGHAFGTPLDHRVHEAMQKVHAKGVFRRGDFPDDTVNLLAEMAGDPAIRPEAKIDPNSATKQQVAAQQRMAAEFRHPDVCAGASAQ